MNTVSFPGLGIHDLKLYPDAFKIGEHPIAWYGIIIAVGLLLALLYGMKNAKKFNVSVDDLSDIIIFGIIFGVIGARIYYVIFYPSSSFSPNPYFQDPLSILYIWNGGLAIYGGIIAAFITGFVVSKIKKISFGAVFDVAALGFLIGQAIGRWGNFVNGEAFGGPTSLPWGMVVNGADPVHPCFLYESLWCIIGFVILHIYSKKRKFDGEIFLMYAGWYSFGRFFIEGLRSDSLMIGNLKVSQLVAGILFVTAMTFLVYKRVTLKNAVKEETAEYNPLFEETSKAVEADTAAEAKKYDFADEDEEAEATGDASETSEQPDGEPKTEDED